MDFSAPALHCNGSLSCV